MPRSCTAECASSRWHTLAQMGDHPNKVDYWKDENIRMSVQDMKRTVVDEMTICRGCKCQPLVNMVMQVRAFLASNLSVYLGQT